MGVVCANSKLELMELILSKTRNVGLSLSNALPSQKCVSGNTFQFLSLSVNFYEFFKFCLYLASIYAGQSWTVIFSETSQIIQYVLYVFRQDSLLCRWEKYRFSVNRLFLRFFYIYSKI